MAGSPSVPWPFLGSDGKPYTNRTLPIDDGGAVQVTDAALLAAVEAPLASGSKVGLDGSGFLPSGVTPVTGSFTAVGQSETLAPHAGRGFNVSLWGAFAGAVRLERSFDAGTTWLPISAAGTPLYTWTAPASESAQEDEAGVLYRLNCTAYTSGTITYRLSQ